MDRFPTRTFASHLPYLRNLDLVEEKQVNTRLFPHTSQLPRVYAAIQKEFVAGISSRMANTDYRADDLRKYERFLTVTLFCSQFSSMSKNALLVIPYYSRDA